ncbi:hypothetical protein E2C01_032744 [Portunus trituberculatus]|uniref:Uncharacterized protein n=1 Tax=Portunus trituberculatus TaxID=210409 RepID=A0A5B7F170_PORTR|nr:hypothetical protein [Portunus trituberculatus]
MKSSLKGTDSQSGQCHVRQTIPAQEGDTRQSSQENPLQSQLVSRTELPTPIFCPEPGSLLSDTNLPADMVSGHTATKKLAVTCCMRRRQSHGCWGGQE